MKYSCLPLLLRQPIKKGRIVLVLVHELSIKIVYGRLHPSEHLDMCLRLIQL